MVDVYVDPQHGQDSNPGSFQQPWLSLDHALLALGLTVPPAAPVATPPTINLLPGLHVQTPRPIRAPVTITAPMGSVQLEPYTHVGAWTQVQLGTATVWHASLLLAGTRNVWQAVWQFAPGQPVHRIPVWTNAAPLSTALVWAQAVTGPANPHTRWGLWSTSTDVYLIPPPDGSFSDPNTVRVLVASDNGMWLSGPDIHVVCDPGGIWLPVAGAGVYVDWFARRTLLDGLRISCCKSSIQVRAGGNATTGWLYSDGHQFQHLSLEDNGQHFPMDASGNVPQGDAQSVHQLIPWTAAKTTLDLGIRDASGNVVLVNKAINSAEGAAYQTMGGATNVTFQDSTIDGCWDGINHWSGDHDYDGNANLNLLVQRVQFRNIPDDTTDISRRTYGAVLQDCDICNVGTVASPAPFFGTLTYDGCRAWIVGEQVRMPDGTGYRPPGSFVKCGGLATGQTPGTLRLENCQLWSDTPSTEGVSQDGGTTSVGPRIEIVNTLLRTGQATRPLFDWPYPASTLLDQNNTWATDAARPIKSTTYSPVIVPAAQADRLLIVNLLTEASLR